MASTANSSDEALPGFRFGVLGDHEGDVGRLVAEVRAEAEIGR